MDADLKKYNIFATIYFERNIYIYKKIYIIYIIYIYIFTLIMQKTCCCQGSRNCTHGDERAPNVHAKRFLRARNYVHVNQSKHF